MLSNNFFSFIHYHLDYVIPKHYCMPIESTCVKLYQLNILYSRQEHPTWTDWILEQIKFHTTPLPLPSVLVLSVYVVWCLLPIMSSRCLIRSCFLLVLSVLLTRYDHIYICISISTCIQQPCLCILSVFCQQSIRTPHHLYNEYS